MISKYAKLIIETGVNIQQGQYLYITSQIETAEFARLLTKEAYEKGAKKVYVNYIDEKLVRTHYDYAPDEAFLEYPAWEVAGKEELASKNCAFISISGSNPELLKGIDAKKIATSNATASTALRGYYKYIENSEVSWCVVSVPTESWSKKVFPELDTEQAIKALWDKIFVATRVYENDPIAAWKKHTSDIATRTKFLDDKKIKSLHYVAPNTDLVVELPEGHVWAGGGEYNKAGTFFVANMPTEEIFTMPHKYKVNGKLSSTKPLAYSGNIIDEFTLYFENGKIVNFEAKQGYDTLKALINTDEGSHYLGEVALVPFNSTVSNTNTLFYNTLFDENASCHFAIGNAYPENITGGKTMTAEELEAVGANVSLTHVDFMVGSDKLDVVATTIDGEQFDVLKNGDWAF